MDFNTEVLKYKDDFLKDLNTLVSYESVRDESTKAENAPFGKNCRDVLDAMLDMAKRDGFETKDIDGYAGVVEYGQGEETFGVLGHLDIVPLGEGWTKDPLKVTLENGYIFGRGVMDDKGPALAGYYALKMIRDLNIPLKKRVMLITGCDEESGMECMNYYVDHAEVPQMGFVPDANFPVIYGEKGGLEWRQMEPNTLTLRWRDRPTEILDIGNNGYLTPEALWNTRTPAGHPEGFIEAFANIYHNFSLTVRAIKNGETPSGDCLYFPTVYDGVRGMQFIETMVEAGYNDNVKWQKWID